MENEYSNVKFEILDITARVVPPAIYVNRGLVVTFNKRTVEVMERPQYVQYCISPSDRIFAVKKCKEEDFKAAKFFKNQKDGSVTYATKMMHDVIASLIPDYDKTKRYIINGLYDSERNIMYYDFNKAYGCDYVHMQQIEFCEIPEEILEEFSSIQKKYGEIYEEISDTDSSDIEDEIETEEVIEENDSENEYEQIYEYDNSMEVKPEEQVPLKREYKHKDIKYILRINGKINHEIHDYGHTIVAENDVVDIKINKKVSWHGFSRVKVEIIEQDENHIKFYAKKGYITIKYKVKKISVLTGEHEEGKIIIEVRK